MPRYWLWRSFHLTRNIAETIQDEMRSTRSRLQSAENAAHHLKSLDRKTCQRGIVNEKKCSLNISIVYDVVITPLNIVLLYQWLLTTATAGSLRFRLIFVNW